MNVFSETNLPNLNLFNVLTGLILAPILYALLRVIYNIFFHPLRSYPGPKLWATSRIPWNYVNLHGELAWKIRDLHEQYGPVVRIAPDELSYTTGTAWKKIYGQRSPEFPKCLDGRGIAPPSINGIKGIVTEDQERHARLRRAIQPAFSERALRDQEGFLQLYSDQLMEQLKRGSKEGPQNMARWYALTTFDIVSDLAFGQSAGCLQSADQPHIQIIGTRAKSIVWFQAAIYYGLFRFMDKLAPQYTIKSRQKHIELTTAKVMQRLQQQNPNKDFMSYILDNKTENLSNLELVIMASSFLVAGSGTTAGGLTAITFFLGRNPQKYKILAEEIRSSFLKSEDITMASTAHLKYLQAVIEEGLRLYPPSPCTLPRFVPSKGEEIEGKWVPRGIAVGVHQLSAGHSELNFRHAKSFIPERWLDLNKDSEFINDDKSAIQPFSYGPRNCVGKSMAYNEMRLILSKLLWNFNFELVDKSDAWQTQQKTYLVWEKVPLVVKLSPRSTV